MNFCAFLLQLLLRYLMWTQDTDTADFTAQLCLGLYMTDLDPCADSSRYKESGYLQQHKAVQGVLAHLTGVVVSKRSVQYCHCARSLSWFRRPHSDFRRCPSPWNKDKRDIGLMNPLPACSMTLTTVHEDCKCWVERHWPISCTEWTSLWWNSYWDSWDFHHNLS